MNRHSVSCGRKLDGAFEMPDRLDVVAALARHPPQQHVHVRLLLLGEDLFGKRRRFVQRAALVEHPRQELAHVGAIRRQPQRFARARLGRREVAEAILEVGDQQQGLHVLRRERARRARFAQRAIELSHVPIDDGAPHVAASIDRHLLDLGTEVVGLIGDAWQVPRLDRQSAASLGIAGPMVGVGERGDRRVDLGIETVGLLEEGNGGGDLALAQGEAPQSQGRESVVGIELLRPQIAPASFISTVQPLEGLR